MEQVEGAVEAPQVSEAALLVDDIQSVLLTCRTDQEGLAEIATMITAFVAQEVQAALGHVEYIHMMESDDKADKAVEARVARIVAALELHLKYASNAHDEATTPTLQRYYLGEFKMAKSAIAIAREEGEG